MRPQALMPGGVAKSFFVALPGKLGGGHDWARTSDLTDVNRETTLSPRVPACREWLAGAENGEVPCRGESPHVPHCRPNCISNCITAVVVLIVGAWRSVPAV